MEHLLSICDRFAPGEAPPPACMHGRGPWRASPRVEGPVDPHRSARALLLKYACMNAHMHARNKHIPELTQTPHRTRTPTWLHTRPPPFPRHLGPGGGHLHPDAPKDRVLLWHHARPHPPHRQRPGLRRQVPLQVGRVRCAASSTPSPSSGSPPQDTGGGPVQRVRRHAPRRQRHRLRRPQLRGRGGAGPRPEAQLAHGVNRAWVRARTQLCSLQDAFFCAACKMRVDLGSLCSAASKALPSVSVLCRQRAVRRR